MANLCKFDKKQYQVSYDSGVTWENVIPEQIDRGDNMIEYDSQDCSSVDTMYRWRTLDGQYLCDGKEKWTKEIQEESYNNGLTWYTSYPTVYRRGTYVGIDETFCNDKFVGHYVVARNTTSAICPKNYYWNGHKCVYHMKYDPLKIVKCNDSGVLTSEETRYYGEGYSLISCEIGDCVTTIDNLIFRNNAVISSVTISNSVTTIGDYAFQGCSNLTRINSETNGVFNVPSSAIGGQAFKDCTSLSSVTISESIISIGGGAFRNCSSLTSITINALIPPTLGNWAFLNTNNCPIYVPCASVVLYKRAGKWSDYASRIQAIEDSPCELTPTGATKIQATYSNGENYFIHCNSSTELISREARPNGYDNSTMTSAEIGDCVTKIGYQAFLGCSSLSSFDIPSGVTSISDSAFSGCTSLTSITVHATTPPSLGTDSTWATHVFDNTNNCPIYVPCNSLPLYKPRYPWSHYASRIQGIESPCKPTPSGATKIYLSYNNGEIYFKYSDDNTTLSSGDTRPDSYNYAKIESAVIGNYITSISLRTFYGCTSLTSIDIPSGVTEIGESAFQDCTSLRSIDIPNGVTSIGNNCFYNCTGLTSVTVNALTPPTLGTNAFGRTNDCPIYVPCESVETYKGAENWSDYASRIYGIPPCGEEPLWKLKTVYGDGTTYSKRCGSETSLTRSETKPSGYIASAMMSAVIGDCVTTIEDYVFSGCTSLSSVTIGNGVTSIGWEVFENCKKLTSIDIPNSVTYIGPVAFGGCTSLSSVTIPSGITTIGFSAFQNCSALTSVVIPSGVTNIGVRTCENCISLRNLTIGNGVTSIGLRAFYGCTSLTSIDIPSGVTSIGEHAFDGCRSLTSITVHAATPPTLDNNTVFSNSNCPIYVPSGSVDTYKSAKNWSTYASRIQPIT